MRAMRQRFFSCRKQTGGTYKPLHQLQGLADVRAEDRRLPGEPTARNSKPRPSDRMLTGCRSSKRMPGFADTVHVSSTCSTNDNSMLYSRLKTPGLEVPCLSQHLQHSQHLDATAEYGKSLGRR